MTTSSTMLTRRTMMSGLAGTPLAIGGGGGLGAASAATGPALVGAITGNDPADYLRFARFLGRKPALALLAFNQTSPATLSGSIPYLCGQAKPFLAAGARILWSVPMPGAKALEGIVAGSFDPLYRTLFKAILAASPGAGPILVRLPWEFNLPEQENAAMDRAGRWDAALFAAAWTRLAGLARAASPRLQRIWCPNATTKSVDPAICWPGPDHVEIVAQDVYLQTRYNKPGDFDWFLREPRGLAWGAEFARAHGKPYGLSEWGMDGDLFAPDLARAAGWLRSLGARAHHHCWWDRPEVIDCRISDGTHPRLAAAYKAAFA